MLCGVDHEDLKQLVRVSKTVREAVSFEVIWFSAVHFCSEFLFQILLVFLIFEVLEFAIAG